MNLLPEADGYAGTINVPFPDFSKAWLYIFAWQTDYNAFAEEYGWSSLGQTLLTALPQEWESTTVLASVPAGADYFRGLIKLNRTTSPTHDWGGQPVNVLQPQNVWIPLTGSILVENELIMARVFSIYIDGGNLVLYQKQSIGPAPGGYGLFGYGLSAPTQADGSGGQWNGIGGEGLPIWGQVSEPYLKTSSGTAGGVFPPAGFLKHKWDGPDPASMSDPTSFASTYSVQIKGQFGRRS